MIVVEAKNGIEIVLQTDKSLHIREYKCNGVELEIVIKPEDVLRFETCLIRLLEDYNG